MSRPRGILARGLLLFVTAIAAGCEGRVSGRIGKGSLEPAAVASAVSTAMSDFPVRPSR